MINMQDKKERINHVHYYNNSKAELIDVIRYLDFDRANAIKYIYRAWSKDPTTAIEDLQKAVWYIQDYINNFLVDNPND